MDIKKGDYVSRKSYNNDIIFKVINIKNDVYYLKGADVRLYADSFLEDLIKEEIKEKKEEISTELQDNNSDRGDFFYLPAKILHIDGDSEYLDRCLKYYKNLNVYAIGKKNKRR